jgi:hypothetical protein
MPLLTGSVEGGQRRALKCGIGLRLDENAILWYDGNN